MIFTSEAKRVLYRKGADIPEDGRLNESTWILIQICFVDQHGVGPLIRLTDEWTNSDGRNNILDLNGTDFAISLMIEEE